MITQNDVKVYVGIRKAFDAAKATFEAAKVEYVSRIYDNKEEVEQGDLVLSIKAFPKTSTKYKEVVEGMAEAVQDNPELLERLTNLLKEFSKTDMVKYPEVTTVEEVVVKKVKKTKVA